MVEGDIAQLVERCPCKADVSGSNPLVSTHPPLPLPWVRNGRGGEREGLPPSSDTGQALLAYNVSSNKWRFRPEGGGEWATP